MLHGAIQRSEQKTKKSNRAHRPPHPNRMESPLSGPAAMPAAAGAPVNPHDTLARLRSCRAALSLSVAGVEAAAGITIETLDTQRDLLECLSLKREVFKFGPAERALDVERRDDAALMVGRAHRLMSVSAVQGMEAALLRSRAEMDLAVQHWDAAVARDTPGPG